MVELRERKLTLDLCDNETVKWEHDGERFCVHVQQDPDPWDPREDEGCVDLMACWHRNYRLGDHVEDGNPETFWRRLVRERVPYADIYAAAEAGKLTGIRLAPNGEEPDRIDVFETYYLRTVIGNSPPSECLEYEALRKDGVVEYILDDLTVGHCMTLLEPYAEWLPLWLYDHSGITMSCGARTYPYNAEWDSGQVGWIIAFKWKIMSDLCVSEAEWRERAIADMQSSVKVYDQYLTGDVYGFTLYKADGDEWEEMDSCWGFYGSDVVESGLAESVGNGLMKAIEADQYRTGTAERHTHVEISFAFA